MIEFKNRYILVTGASSGIGREIAIQLSNFGANVALSARNQTRLQDTLSRMSGDHHQVFLCDLEKLEEIPGFIDSVTAGGSLKVDGFIHSAGLPSVYPLRSLNHDKLDSAMKVHTYAYLEILKHLSKKKYSNEEMSVVYLSSILTKKANHTGQLSYIASKVAGETLAKSLSLEFYKRKIRVNSVVAGGVATAMDSATEGIRALAQEHQSPTNGISRYLSAEEVSNMVLFLMSDCAKYIVGETYYVDGGHI